MIRLNLSNSYENEGGSEESSEDHSKEDRKANRNSDIKGKYQKKRLDSSNVDLNSDDWASEINLNERKDKDIKPGRIFNSDKVINNMIEEIPLSAFESSRSSDSSDTFESQYEEDMVAFEEPNQAKGAQKVKF